MYNDFFRFRQTPFSIAPDPNFLFLSERHREALAHLLYGLKTDGGFVLVTGEVGTGKTTLIRSLIEQTPDDLDLAFILNSRLNARELLETLCDELGAAPISPGTSASADAGGMKPLIDRLTHHLLDTYAAGRSTVLIIDEAQNLEPDVLEQIRLLTNLETNSHKLLRIILVGQPELDRLLARPDLRQLAQRITARCHLQALNRTELRAYLGHRLTLAGGHPGLIQNGAQKTIYQYSGGIPRLANLVADRALLGAYVEGKPQVSRRIVHKAAQEVLGRRQAGNRWQWALAASLLLCVTAGLLVWTGLGRAPSGLIAAQDSTAPGAADGSSEIDTNGSQISAGEHLLIPVPPDALHEHDEDFLIIGPGRPMERHRELPVSHEPAQGADTDAGDVIRPSLSEQSNPSDQSDTQQTPDIASPALLPDRGDAIHHPQRPSGLSRAASQRQAFAALFDAWEARLADDGIPCNQAPTQGLQCLRHTGSWPDLLQLDRPALLQLEDAAGERFFAALLQIRGDMAQIQIGQVLRQVTLASLADAWPGNAVVLWQMPPDYRGSLRAGDHQPGVAWLREQLAGLMDLDLSASDPENFDSRLESAVRAFQREHALEPDGIAGPRTWIMLANQLDQPPRLSGPTDLTAGR